MKRQKSGGSFVDILRRRAQEQGGREAYSMLSSRGRSAAPLTYASLDARVRAIAALLQQHCRRGDRALIVYPPGLDYICAFYACLYAGVIAVPSYPPTRAGGSRAASRFYGVAANAGISCLLASASMLDSVRKSLVDSGFTENIFWLATDDPALEEGADAWQAPDLAPDDLAFLQYTSGSTGEPKGVMVSHGNLIANSELIHQRFGHSPESRGVIWLPPYHDMGLIGGILQPLYGGFPTTLMSPVSFVQSPLLWLEMVSKYRATTSGGPDFAYAQCVLDIQDDDLKRLDLSSWKVAFTGAEPIRSETLDQFSRKFEPCGFDPKAFYPCYGLAESTLFVSGSNPRAGIHRLTVDASALAANRVAEVEEAPADGTPALTIVGSGSARQDQHAVRIADPETCEALPEGRIGEIWVSGPSVAKGYWQNAEATRYTFAAHLTHGDGRGDGPFMRTGDLGFLRGDELYITGRIKDLIIVRGRNHYPHDIEATIIQSDSRFPRVGSMAVFLGAADDLVLLCEGGDELAAQSDVLLQQAGRAITELHGLRLDELVIVKPRSLPKTSSGKLRRFACRQMFLQGQLQALVHAKASAASMPEAAAPEAPALEPARADTAAQAPGESLMLAVSRDRLRGWLVASIAQALKQPEAHVDPDREFFQLGLDSMAITRLSALLEDRIGRPVDTVWFFDYPTVNRLVDHLLPTAKAGTGAAAPSRVGAGDAGSRELAVIGLSCRFPGAPSKAAFWELLADGRDAITEVPANRWDVDHYYDADPGKPGKSVSRWGGFTDDADLFDADLFGIPQREAIHMDPQHRMLMELAFEALQDAGLSADSLRGSSTGVFVGISSNDYSLLQDDPQHLGPYSGVGNAHSVAANRISYFFDFHGPSVAVDTACSSALVALHLASRALQAGDCDLALVGGVNLMLSPHLHVVFSQARMMAADGRCKAFDDGADGYVRGEGGGFVVLRRMPEAVQHRDRLLARICASAVNQDGRSNGLTAPNARAQESVIRSALAQAGLAPEAIEYVETHGTGTKLGDPIEFKALHNVYAQTARPQPLRIGSVKSNIGHLEAAAGMASVIKVVLSMHHGVLPEHLHFRSLNQQIRSEGGDGAAITVCKPGDAWSAAPGERLAGVSSFGFGGTNCHVLLGDVKRPVHDEPTAAGKSLPPPVLTLSAASPRSLRLLCDRFAGHMAHLAQLAPGEFADACHTANLSRADLPYRWAATAPDAEGMRKQLKKFVDASTDAWKARIRTPGVLFAFSGQGAQVPGMGSELERCFPVFRQAIDACEEVLRAHWPTTTLRAVLRGEARDGEGSPLLQRTEFAQAAIFSHQYALAQWWMSLGARPAGVIGHSLGEYAAACVAGVMTLPDALALLVARGRLMQSVREDGRMAVLYASEHEAARLLAPFGQRLCVAAVNAPEVLVVSGRDGDVHELLDHCAALGVVTKLMPGSHAFHSADLDPVLDAFERVVADVKFFAPTVPLYSNVDGSAVTSAEHFTARYWRDQMRGTVQFAQGVAQAVQPGVAVLLELGSDATLCALAGRCVPARSLKPVPSGRGTRPELQSSAEALAALYTAGVAIDWQQFHAGTALERVELPPYTFDRKRYWLPRTAALVGSSDPSVSHTRAEQRGPSVSPEFQGINNMNDHTFTAPSAAHSASSQTMLNDIRQIVASLLEISEDQIDDDAPFLEMGADSLVLLSAIQAIDDKYGIHLSINQLFDSTSTIRALAAFIEANAVIESMGKRPPAEDARMVPEEAPRLTPVQRIEPPQPLQSLARPSYVSAELVSSDPVVTDLFKTQLQVMAEQISLLKARSQTTFQSEAVAPPRAAEARRLAPAESRADVPANGQNKPQAKAAESAEETPAAPFSWAKVAGERASHGLPAWARQPQLVSDNSEPALKSYVNDLLARHVVRTGGSKQLTQKYRPVLADNRASAGFRLSTKEGVYPIFGKRAQGARMWDVDGNEYVDFTMGFGANLFGHSPDFIVDELRKQIDEGFQLGPQCDLAGMVAERIVRITGHDRVAFCNSGSEAVMTAVRLARAVTKRSKVAIFSGSYHGTFDGILARSRVAQGHLQTVPIAPGTPVGFVEREVLVLEYGQEDSLRILRENAHTLAAVLIEPVQSRFPAHQPAAFLKALRVLTEEKSIAMIWDETITGFRAAPGGAQEYFGIQGDLATYGKIIGGGMPIGVVAGKSRFLDAIDGGTWNYGDASYPKAEQTFFAGTFNKHPLAMRAALAVLDRLEAGGAQLQQALNQHTAQLAGVLNNFFTTEDLPIRVEHFSSLFRFSFSGNMDMLFLMLMQRGIYIWEGRNCFLSTAHSEKDIQQLVDAVKSVTLELRAQGFFSTASNAKPTAAAAGVATAAAAMPLNSSQARFARWARSPGDAAVSHIPFAVRLSGPGIRPEALQAAFNTVIARHDALRGVFDLAAGTQSFVPQASLALQAVDFSGLDAASQDEAVRAWQRQEVVRDFDLSVAPLMRVALLRLSDTEHVLHLVVHHIVSDGLSLALMLDEVSRLYSSGADAALPKALSLAEDLAQPRVVPGAAEGRIYWDRQLVSSPPPLLPVMAHGGPASAGARVRTVLDGTALRALKAAGKEHKATPFMVLFAAYSMMLAEKSGQRDMLIGVPTIDRLPRAGQVLLGCFVNLLPLRIAVDSKDSFPVVLKQVKDQLLGAYRHSAVVGEAGPWVPGAIFNLEPQTVPPVFGSMTAELLESPMARVEFDVMLNATQAEDALYLDLDFRLQALTPSGAREWLERYSQILDSATRTVPVQVPSQVHVQDAIAPMVK